MYKLPHKIIDELRKEVEELRRVSKENSEKEGMEGIEYSRVESLDVELKLKNKYISELEGDMKQMKSMTGKENMQYLRHTLVKFLCDCTRSEQTKLVPVVEELLEMRYI